MISSGAVPPIDRRTLLRTAILLVGGSVAAGGAVPALAAVEGARFFTPTEFEILAAVADTIIPRTDTPGAKDAGVPEAFDSLMANWASDARQAEFRSLIGQFGAADVASLEPTRRLDFVRQFDAAKLAVNDPVYVKFRELVLTLYYLSEAGATQELRYELIPGKWDPAVVIGTDTRAWAV